MAAPVQQLLHTLHIVAQDESIYETACTHRSAANEDRNITAHNERLEFLGDAVLELISTEYLYHKFPHVPEGTLTALRSSLVKGETLAQCGREISLGNYIIMSQGETAMDGQNKDSILANTMEAIIGALYLDSGMLKTTEFIHTYILSKTDNIIESGDFIDAKSYFQQYAQAEYKTTPVYKDICESGPDHEKTFTIGVYIDHKEFGRGQGNSKQSAQQAASRQALDNLQVPWKNIFTEASQLKNG